MLIMFFFFFQAEDGIRDLTVTGVQTCALPILKERVGSDYERQAVVIGADALLHLRLVRAVVRRGGPDRGRIDDRRSEERRVGKECRSGWSPDHKKKKKNRSRRTSTSKTAIVHT